VAKITPVVDKRGNIVIEDPPIARYLFSNTQIAWIWLIARVWLGFAWIEAASHKVTDPAWAGGNGEALKSFWERALAVAPAGKPVIAVDWYRDFIQALYNAEAWTWMAPIIAWSEMLIGVALILGVFTGIAAFGGTVLNWSFVMAGTASTNMLMFAVAALVILAWKTAGWWGADRWLLPLVGTPWAAGRVQVHRAERRPPAPRAMAA
jgi:thiosulfate dehydrogenase [quinone] large subunit